MRIFFLHKDPNTCAGMLADSHIGKGLLECAQMLYTAHHVAPEGQRTDWQAEPLLPKNVKHPYKPTHTNVQIARWVRACIENYRWTCQHALALADIYKQHHERTHASTYCVRWLAANVPLYLQHSETGDITDPPTDKLPDDCRGQKDWVACFRAYYAQHKSHLLTFTYQQSARNKRRRHHSRRRVPAAPTMAVGA